jgi:hypothetical protein
MEEERATVRVYVKNSEELQNDFTAILQTALAVTAFVGLLFTYVFSSV